MSHKSFIIIFVILGSLFTQEAFGQYPDSLFWFKAPSSSFYEAGDLNALKGDFSFALPEMRTISAQTAKKLSVPRSSKVMADDVVITAKRKCFRLGSKNGQLVWWDRNRDGKIQPLREVRCIGPKGKASKVFVEEVSCK